MILTVLIAQYLQSVVLMIRRILSDAVAGVAYAMFFLALSGFTALFQSFAISLINVSWTFNEDIQPCTEALCNFSACLAPKESVGLPIKEFRITAVDENVVSIPKTILYQFAAGFLQCSILLRLDWGLLYNWSLLYNNILL